MDIQQILYARLHNQFLLQPASPEHVTKALCGIQAQFFSHARHALRIRCGETEAESLSGMVKNWTLRGTMHLFHQADLHLFLAGCGQLYRKNEWTEKSWWNQRPDWALTPRKQQDLAEIILDNLAKGSMTREEMKTYITEMVLKLGHEKGGFMYKPYCTPAAIQMNTAQLRQEMELMQEAWQIRNVSK